MMRAHHSVSLPPGALRVRSLRVLCVFFFFFNDTATTEIYTLSLHDALPISTRYPASLTNGDARGRVTPRSLKRRSSSRSEEHTSELQSRLHLVCRLLLEKKKKIRKSRTDYIYQLFSVFLQ